MAFNSVPSRFWDSLGIRIVAMNSKDPSSFMVFIHKDYSNPIGILTLINMFPSNLAFRIVHFSFPLSMRVFGGTIGYICGRT